MIWLRMLCAVTLALGSPGVAGAESAAPPLEVYGRLPGVERAAISPSGGRIVLIGMVNDHRELIVVENGVGIFRKPLADDKIRGVEWAGEDKLLLRFGQTVSLGMGFTTDKAELTGMLVVPIGPATGWMIFDNYHHVTGGVAGYHGMFEREGARYGYFGGMTVESATGGDYLANSNPALFEVNLENGKTRRVADRIEDQIDWRDWLVGPNGKVAASLDFITARGEWKIKNAERSVIASGRARTGGVSLLSFGRTADTIIYYLRDDDGGARLFEQPIAGGAPTEILSEYAMSCYHYDRRTGELIGYESEGDVPEDHFFDGRREKAMNATRKAFPGLTVKLIDYNHAFNRLIVRTSGVGDPETWWLVDTKAGSATVLGTAYPMPASNVGPMRMVKYKAADGLDMAGVLTLPPGREPKNLPVVILPHGGPTSRDHPVFDWWAQALASRGYAVFQPNFRGSSGLGADFLRAGWGQWGGKMQTDISDGLAALARQEIIDPKRACIVGASYGGYAALAGVTLQQGLYRCAVSVSGIGDVAKMVSTDVSESGYDATLKRALKKEVGSGRDLALISPIRFADRADAPILLIHGLDDTTVLFSQSRDMAAALKRAGKPVELVTLKGEDHSLSRSETRLIMLKALVGFLEKYNPPDAASVQ